MDNRPIPKNKLTGQMPLSNEEIMLKVRYAIESERKSREWRIQFDRDFTVGLKPIPFERFTNLKLINKWQDNSLAYDNY